MEKGEDNNETKFTIEGNPGTGNTFINIGKAINVNPNATTVENNFFFGADGEMKRTALQEIGIGKPSGKKLGNMTIREMLSQNLIDTGNIQKDIINYVSRIRPYVKDEKEKLFMQLWASILEHAAFKIDLYDPGKQPCEFNRNLVANIIHYLDSMHFYKAEYNQSEMTRALEGDDQHAIRRALRSDPEEKYAQVVDAILKELDIWKQNPKKG